MLKQSTEVQGVFYWARGDQRRAVNHEGTTFCSGSPSSQKQLEAAQKQHSVSALNFQLPQALATAIDCVLQEVLLLYPK